MPTSALTVAGLRVVVQFLPNPHELTKTLWTSMPDLSPDFPQDAVDSVSTTVPPAALTQELAAVMYCDLKAVMLDTSLDPTTPTSITSTVPWELKPSQILTLGGWRKMTTSALTATELRAVVVHVVEMRT